MERGTGFAGRFLWGAATCLEGRSSTPELPPLAMISLAAIRPPSACGISPREAGGEGRRRIGRLALAEVAQFGILAQFAVGLGLDLADPLPGQAESFSDLLQGVLVAVFQTEAHG